MRRAQSKRPHPATIGLVTAIGCAVAAAPTAADPLRLSAYVTVTETYTSNVNYSVGNLAEGDFVTSVSAGLNINGEWGGKRLKVSGSIGASQQLYIGQSQNNSFAPSVNVLAKLEAIENFAFVDAQASITPTFISPFGAQPANVVNATPNRYTQQIYAVSPYIRGIFGSSNISYQARDDNYWTVSTGFGNSSAVVPNTYANNLNASMSSPVNPWGWTLSFSRQYYDNGLAVGNGITGGGAVTNDTTTTYYDLLGTLPYQVDPQLQLSLRAGYQSYQFAGPTIKEGRYGIGFQWNPTDRTQVGGFWDHTFFGASYSAQISHRLPNSALSANFSRGITSFPQLALAIPAGATVNQFVDAAFTTRIPDPAERALAVEQFLARAGLPPTLASPVNFYATSLTLQQSATVSLVLIGTRNSVTFTVFNVKTEDISRSGEVLPPALQFGQNNTQTGGGVSVSHRLSGFTTLGASATYSTATANVSTGPFADARSRNGNASVTLGTQFGPKTTGSASVSYSETRFTGAVNPGTTSALNIIASVTHYF
jgi:uncharacterized protein (PEP-CTERM system associated)